MNNIQQPREYDAVLGGNIAPEGAAVLGGIEGLKLRLQNPDINVVVAAIKQALDYEEAGLDLVIECLKSESIEVQNAAYLELKTSIYMVFDYLDPGKKGKIKEALINSSSYLRIGGTADNSKLNEYLMKGKWREADQETMRIMLLIAKREIHGWLDTNSLTNFPCSDLEIIDNLWRKYSNSKFGFSVQKQVFESLGGMQNKDWQMWNIFADAVGWKTGANIEKYADEYAHFPFAVINSKRDGLSGIRLGLQRLVILRWLFLRCETCQL